MLRMQVKNPKAPAVKREGGGRLGPLNTVDTIAIVIVIVLLAGGS
jgi:hypothetical protein